MIAVNRIKKLNQLADNYVLVIRSRPPINPDYESRFREMLVERIKRQYIPQTVDLQVNEYWYQRYQSHPYFGKA